ncbi:hypothetical protein MHBO_001627 [Bonamia ostreae]|uniref:Uncharacterized protein n=1 Tax=Bonamia ostreae TaxID=126728 RepID=A0ABV2AJN3_9EUKA
MIFLSFIVVAMAENILMDSCNIKDSIYYLATQVNVDGNNGDSVQFSINIVKSGNLKVFIFDGKLNFGPVQALCRQPNFWENKVEVVESFY